MIHQLGLHIKEETSNIKMEPSNRDCAPWSLEQDRPTLPSINALLGDLIDFRRSSTASSTSSSSYMTTRVNTPAPSPVDATGDMQARTIRRLQQITEHIHNGSASQFPHPSPASSPRQTQKERRTKKIKARSMRGVSSCDSDANLQDPDPKRQQEAEIALQKLVLHLSENPPDPKRKQKAQRETVARQKLSLALSRLWRSMLRLNPDLISKGVTLDGKVGLKRLKKNNIDEGLAEAGITPLEVNKDHCNDLAALMLDQLRELVQHTVGFLRRTEYHGQADELADALAAVGTAMYVEPGFASQARRPRL